MKRKHVGMGVALVLALVLLASMSLAQAPAPQAVLGTAFTYQGRLDDGGSPANGTYDFEFKLFDDPVAGNRVGGPIDIGDLQVTDGLFSVKLDFGDIFTGAALYLEIGVRPGASGGSYTVLSPRQELTATPYAAGLRPGARVVASLSDAPYALFYAENQATAGTAYGVEGVTASPAGAGVFGTSDWGAGGYFSSKVGHALIAEGPNLIGGRNPLQIAMLRWYDANTSGITLSVDPFPDQFAFDGEHMWVTSFGAGTVTKIRASDATIVGVYSACPGANPIAFDGYYIWVGAEQQPCVAKIRASDGATVATLNDLPSGHTGIAFDGTYVWVTNRDAYSVTKIRASDNVEIGTYTVGNTPTGIVFDGENLWVALYNAYAVAKVRPSDGQVIGTYPIGQTGWGVAFDGANVWVSGSSLTKLRASDGAVLGSYPIDGGTICLAFDGYSIWATSYLSSGKVTRLRASDGAILGSYAAGSYPMGVSFDGANIWVANTYDATVAKY